MAAITVSGSSLGNGLQILLMADDIDPGDEPSYQICKTIYLYHPLGAKMAESPIRMAQSQAREIVIPNSPEDQVRAAFLRQWKEDGADGHILNTMTTARIYGVASIALMVENAAPKAPADFAKLASSRISFNILDPLNTAGSLVLSQNPNAIDFQKSDGIAISGIPYHRSRTVTVMNEKPIYIAYTSSAFGYVGRSVYQRALFPLKSFIQSMVTDDMVQRKGGVLVAMMQQAGSIIDNIMAKMAGIKRSILKEAQTDNVVSIGKDDKVESLNLQNLEGPVEMSRKHILENIAVAADMPAKLLNQETFAEGFGEGTEDAKAVARYVDRIRIDMAPLYDFFDRIVQHRAWNEEFYKTIQAQFPEQYGNKSYTQAFYEWSNSFKAEWPSLLTEPDSEKIKVEETKLKAIISMAEVLLPEVDPENKARVFQWVADNFNENKMLFKTPLVLDIDELKAFLDEAQKQAAEAAQALKDKPLEEPPEPRGFRDSQSKRGLLAA